MRQIKKINNNWMFSLDGENNVEVQLPHTWNNLDGQDGGADYKRQKAYYKKKLEGISTDKEVYIEFEGVNHIAQVYFNGTYLGEHRGGFSTFRYEITQLIKETNDLEVVVDNSEDLPVYPQQADFTFFGGIYRDVNLIEVDQTHFDLSMYGSAGVFVTPKVQGENAQVEVVSYIQGEWQNTTINYEVFTHEGECVAQRVCEGAKKVVGTLEVKNPILWDGIKNPYLYTLRATIIKEDAVIDHKEIAFGIRHFEVDSERGFILNGESYPLRGVSRHQDRLDKGWAITKKEHNEDMALIKEVGANTIRLAHYQHDQYFYDLCDQEGMVTWAEIPFITMFIPGEEARDNTLSQMRELVLQNYNHPSICFWGISNEITIGGETKELVDNQKALVELIQSYDTTRLTTLANVSFVEMDSEQNMLTDTVGYNHYFGWYGGELTDNEAWIDAFHAQYPDRPLCISEYGAEGILTYHTDTPECRDYTEEYHAVYHEHMVKIFEERPFLWATYQWNMFDFAADARDEGGVKGRNNKGLVTFGREVKKDAFFLYKAYWNKDEKFVHVTGRRYVDRPSEKVTLKVYSNCDEVTLRVNGEVVATQSANKIFIFEDVTLKMGENTITALSGDLVDEIILKRVAVPNETYVLVEDDEYEGEGVKNWFENGEEVPQTLTFEEGYFSIKDTIGEIMISEEASQILAQMLQSGGGMKPNPGMMKMLQGMKLELIIKMAGKKMPKGVEYMINSQLQKIKK